MRVEKDGITIYTSGSQRYQLYCSCRHSFEHNCEMDTFDRANTFSIVVRPLEGLPFQTGPKKLFIPGSTTERSQMAAAHPFGGFNPKPSAWGYNWTQPPPAEQPIRPNPVQQVNHCPSPEQYANLPAALLSTLKREKKPFTYTPGGVNLSEVLNARLQKRIERKKKYSEERVPRQVVVMPTYNTPLDMYSMENAIEALEVQAELVAADKTPSRSATLPRNHTFRFDNDLDPAKGVAQSKAFRVLQIITDTEEDKADHPRQALIEEMRFTGLREKKADIPSRFFHTLQKITGTDDEEQEEQHRTDARPFERPVSRPPFVAQPPPSSVPATTLRRPAAFLPIKTTPQFRPVRQPCLTANGPLGRHPAAGTDF